MLNNLVPNPGFDWDYNERTGYRINRSRESPTLSASCKKLIRNSPINKATVLFNKLPVYLRLHGNNSLELFKKGLDKFLEQIPDEPDSIRRAAKTNSIEHQIDYRNC